MAKKFYSSSGFRFHRSEHATNAGLGEVVKKGNVRVFVERWIFRGQILLGQILIVNCLGKRSMFRVCWRRDTL